MEKPFFIRLRRYHDNEPMIVNVAEIAAVQKAERNTSTLRMRDSVSWHVLESVDDITRLIEQTLNPTIEG